MKRLVLKISDIEVIFALILLSVYAFTTGLASSIYIYKRVTIPVSFALANILLLRFRNTKKVTYMDILPLLLMMTIAFWNNQNIPRKAYESLYFMVSYFSFYMIMSHTVRCQNILLKIFYVVGMFYAVTTVITIVSPAFFYNIVVPAFKDYGESSTTLALNYTHGFYPGLTPNVGTDAIYLVIGMGVPIAYLVTGLKKGKSLSILFLMLLFVALLATGKRAHSAFSFFAALVAYYFMNCDKPMKRTFKILFMLTAVVALLMILINVFPFASRIVEVWIEKIGSDNFDTGRSVLRVAAADLFSQHPLLGIGWDGFMYQYGATFGTQINVHFVFLQLLCEVGILGSIPFFLFFTLSLWHTIAAMKKIAINVSNNRIVKALLFYSIFIEIFFLLYCMTGNPLYDASMLFPYLSSCAIGEYYYRIQRER